MLAYSLWSGYFDGVIVPFDLWHYISVWNTEGVNSGWLKTGPYIVHSVWNYHQLTAVGCIGVWSVVVNHSTGVSDGQNKLIFQWDDDEIRFVVDQHAELAFDSASLLKQQIPINQFNTALFYFQRHMPWVFSMFKLVEVRGDCLFCWYLWNYWPSLFKLFFIMFNILFVFKG